jgi:hypothetical protein
MGGSTWSAADWDAHVDSVAGKSTAAIFSSSGMKSTGDPRTSFNPKDIPFRESRDSVVNPNATPIIIALDVTGSMQDIPDYMVREGLGPTFTEIYDRKPVSDPHIAFMAVGDVDCDNAPLQVTQFEADIRLADQLKEIWLEGGGGGNWHESYTLPWYFAATRTRCDAIEKGRRKGILFTIGDERLPSVLTKEQIKRVFGEGVQADIPTQELYAMASKQFDIFHIVVEQGHHCQHDLAGVLKSWQAVLGQNVLRLKDYTNLSEVIVSTLQVLGGADLDAVADSWKAPGTSLVVKHALGGLAGSGLPASRRPGGGSTGVTRFAAPFAA